MSVMARPAIFSPGGGVGGGVGGGLFVDHKKGEIPELKNLLRDSAVDKNPKQKRAVMELEATLRGQPFGASKINYLMLMMRDPQVHYHVLPRYLEDREFDGVIFSDEPGPPVLSRVARLGGHTLAKLQRLLIDNWHIEDDGGEATPKL